MAAYAKLVVSLAETVSASGKITAEDHDIRNQKAASFNPSPQSIEEQ
jgi:hypothetical protein